MKRIIFTATLILNIALGSHAMDKDRGGANGYNGLPLESYIKDPKALSAYQNFIKPLQSRLSRVSFIGQYFDYVLSHKTWYFVGNLYQTLSREQIGSAVPTDQIALQDFESVWIDQQRFSGPQMTEEEQAKVILHEILMGIKLLRFQSQKEQCLSVITNPINAYQCDEHFDVRTGNPSHMTPTDYNEIRQTVVDLMSLQANADMKLVEDLLNRRHFSNQVFPFESYDTSRGLDVETIRFKLKDAVLSGNWPKYLYQFSAFYKSHPNIKNGEDIKTPLIWKSKGACSMDLVEGSGQSLSVNYRSLFAGEKKFTLDLKPGSFYMYGTDVDNKLNRIQKTFPVWAEDKDITKLQVGDHFVKLVFLADQYGEIEGVHLYEYVITSSATGAKGPSYLPIRYGINEICSLKPQMALEP